MRNHSPPQVGGQSNVSKLCNSVKYLIHNELGFRVPSWQTIQPLRFDCLHDTRLPGVRGSLHTRRCARLRPDLGKRNITICMHRTPASILTTSVKTN
jgi:hypothetical protein